MPTFTTLSFSRSGQSLFTREEIRQLMRIEFDRAQRHSYPIVCMAIVADRLAEVAAVHGFESKEEILGNVVELLKKETRASDFLGCVEGDAILAIFPHTERIGGVQLAERMLRGARSLRFRLGDRSLRITLSVGLAHNQSSGPISFDTLVQVAQEGLEVADLGGGDRIGETELYQLYEKRRRGQPSLEPVPLPSPEEEPETGFRRRLLALLGREGDLEKAAERLAGEIVGQAMDELDSERQSVERARQEAAEQLKAVEQQRALPEDRTSEYEREIDLLRRRVNKLTQSLGMTEEELNRVRLMKSSDDGIASVYRDVQGISMADAQLELKRDLMENIFEANLDLRKKIG